MASVWDSSRPTQSAGGGSGMSFFNGESPCWWMDAPRSAAKRRVATVRGLADRNMETGALEGAHTHNRHERRAAASTLRTAFRVVDERRPTQTDRNKDGGK